MQHGLAGEIVVAVESACFLGALNRLGVSSDGGLSWLLPKPVDWARAKELLLPGRRLPAPGNMTTFAAGGKPVPPVSSRLG